MLDKPKLLSWLKNYQCHVWNDEETECNEGKGVVLETLIQEINAGTFDPTPVQPDIKPGDKVRGKKKALYHGAGIGIVRCIFWDAEGHWADLMYGNGSMAIYPLDELEVITDEN